MEELHKNYIAGEWRNGEAAPNHNPSNTDEVVGHYARASADDAQAAIAAAKDAFPAWSRTGIQQRHDILKTASDEVMARPGFLQRVLDCADQVSTDPLPGPDRAQLLELVS